MLKYALNFQPLIDKVVNLQTAESSILFHLILVIEKIKIFVHAIGTHLLCSNIEN